MVGDVNLFWNDLDDANATEIEIMIAEPSRRRRGLAEEALTLMMTYAVDTLNVSLFRAKIGEQNTPSLRLFHKLGFKEVSRSEYFKEATLELPASLIPRPSQTPKHGTYD
ncbi:hypothetical protein QBZ16_004389 [Prototheca wickerhamii]|uniref:N-acetyltransferase domain-containing protein n=1 Tax=Prototheca wickerhamii TaxID=3111 RepID=A0AAD9II50_PROWI|nr:hypothetical protein QBZ16_004389 [Prototheca wickerhamii]